MRQSDRARPLRWLVMAGHVPADGRGGGIVRVTVELARALHRRDDVDLHLLTTAAANEGVRELIGPGVGTLTLPGGPDALAPAVERYLLGARVRGFDVVQGTKHLLPRRVDARTVLTVHDMILFDRPQDFGVAKRVLLRQPYAASLRQADVLACVSAATRDRLVAWDPSLADRAVVVPLATSPVLLAAAPVPVPAIAGRPFALVVGDTQPRKNLATVVSAWADVVRRRPDAVLVQVGPPPWGRESYGPDHAALVASGHLLQLSRVDDATLRWCYENAAVVLAPSLLEGFGLPAVEALELGAPLVTSLDPALVEVSADEAEHLPATDVSAWTQAALRHLGDTAASCEPSHPQTRRAPRRRRTWDDVAAEMVGSLGGSVSGPPTAPVRQQPVSPGGS